MIWKAGEAPPLRVPVPGERWRHYKGTVYLVHCLAIDEVTGETAVVYQDVDVLDMVGPPYTRKLSVWLEWVAGTVPGVPDRYVPRFAPVSK